MTAFINHMKEFDVNESGLLQNKELYTNLLLQMMEIESFEKESFSLFGQKLIHGTMHLGLGEEATAVGTMAALKDQDYLLVTHRGHGQALAKGVDMNAMMAELLGRQTGTNKGKGGSMHICDFDNRMLGANGIVGANGPLACGAALTIQMKEIEDTISVLFLGDGAMNEGAMMEAMNLASAWNLPVLFILTNNGYGISTSIYQTIKNQNFTQRAQAFGIEAYECDGNNVLDVMETVKLARQHVASGYGPAMVVEHTYRTSGHSKSDKNVYRSQEEIAFWQTHSPIQRFSSFLLEKGVLSTQELETIQNQAVQKVMDAIDYAKAQPHPQVDDLEKDVYAQ